MYFNQLFEGLNRRTFLGTLLPGCAAACLGGHTLLKTSGQYAQPLQGKHPFLQDSGYSYKEMFQITFQSFYIPIMKHFTEKMGKEKFLEMLRQGYHEIFSEAMKNVSRDVPQKNMQSFRDCFNRAFLALTDHLPAEVAERYMNNVYISEVLESTDRIRQLKVTGCLIAEVFREVDAAEIGYVSQCYPDIVLAEAFHPKMKLIRTKTLMMGDDCCNHRYVWEG